MLYFHANRRQVCTMAWAGGEQLMQVRTACERKIKLEHPPSGFDRLAETVLEHNFKMPSYSRGGGLEFELRKIATRHLLSPSRTRDVKAPHRRPTAAMIISAFAADLPQMSSLRPWSWTPAVHSPH